MQVKVSGQLCAVAVINTVNVPLYAVAAVDTIVWSLSLNYSD